MDRPVLIVMCGAPGSGKSTAASEIADGLGFYVVCPDGIREELFGDAADQSDGAWVFGEAYRRMQEALQDGDVPGVVFDATSCRRRARRQVLEEADGLYGHAVCAVAWTSEEECKLRNAQRDRVVPDEVIEKMCFNLRQCPPGYDEGFDEIVDVEELWGLLTDIL